MIGLKVALVGRLGRAPEARTTKTGNVGPRARLRRQSRGLPEPGARHQDLLRRQVAGLHAPRRRRAPGRSHCARAPGGRDGPDRPPAAVDHCHRAGFCLIDPVANRLVLRVSLVDHLS